MVVAATATAVAVVGLLLTAFGVDLPLLLALVFFPPTPRARLRPRVAAARRSAADRIRAESSGDMLCARAPLDRPRKDEEDAGSEEEEDKLPRRSPFLCDEDENASRAAPSAISAKRKARP